MNQVTAHEYTIEDLKGWAKNSLKFAQRNFNMNPSSTRWIVTVRAMFTHQQLQYAKRSPSVDREKLAFDLDQNPVGAWQNIISRATCGEDIHKAMH